MNAIIILNGTDVTDACLLPATRINFDSSKRITTASITVMGQALNAAVARYDAAQYDVNQYSISMRELYEVQILDGRDRSKLFDGYIFALTMTQSDTPAFDLFFQCDLSDWAVWLDRAVCWDASFNLPLPNSDMGIIIGLVGQFCPKIHLANIAQIVPTIQSYDWATKTCRQVLDDMVTLSMGQWSVDFDGNLTYGLASAAPAAPFGLSTSADYVNTFPVRVEGYKHDFTNPVNHFYVRGGADQTTGVAVEASYADPVSIQQYGEYSAGLVDAQIITGWDAALKAKSQVLTYAYPIETGNFTIWKDGLKLGMKVHITEENIGIDGDYTIIALSMQWEDNETVKYTAQFGSAQPDLETILRLMNQRTLWATTNRAPAGAPPPGSITDASIAPGGLSASSINSVSASTIQGQIQAGQIGAINASTIVGQINAGQISTVNAGSVVGVLQSNQIGSINATTIQGVIQANQVGAINAAVIQGVVISSQLADGIIDTMAKYANALRPVRIVRPQDPIWLPSDDFPPGSFFYLQAAGHFYQITPDGLSWVNNDNVTDTVMPLFNVGQMMANSIVGLIMAAQIDSITAGQITGQITAGQIGSVNVSTLAGQIQANQIGTVNANAIQGTISSSQIGQINASQITGQISANQIGSINATTINIGQIQSTQIGSVSGSTLNVGSIPNSAFNGYSIDVGGANSMPGRIRVFNSSAQVVAQMGYLGEVGNASYGGWFQVFGAGGTGYSNAHIYSDAPGNLYIRDANISIGGQITTSPQTFDSTYSTLALINSNAGDSTNFVSRGLVFYRDGNKYGSLTRAPEAVYLVLEMAVGGGYIRIDAPNGVRSDMGYLVAGNRVIDSNSRFTGNGINCPFWGITGAGFNPYVSGVQYNGASGYIWVNGNQLAFTTTKPGPGTSWTQIAGGVVVGAGTG